MNDKFNAFEWKRLLTGLPPELYYLEISLRVLLVFLFLIFMFKLLGKRVQRNLSPMENILTISIGTAVGDVMLYPSIPIFYSFLILVLVSGLITLFSYLKLKFRFLDDRISPRAVLMVDHGKLCTKSIENHLLTKQEIFVMLRLDNVEFLEQVRYALFEPTGEMSVFTFDEGEYEKKTSIIKEVIDNCEE